MPTLTMVQKLFAMPLLSFLLLLPSTLSASTNITVDDQANDTALIYAPTPADAVWHLGPNCTICASHPDPSQAHDGTWHDSTTTAGGDPYTISYTFNGILKFLLHMDLRTH